MIHRDSFAKAGSNAIRYFMQHSVPSELRPSLYPAKIKQHLAEFYSFATGKVQELLAAAEKVVVPGLPSITLNLDLLKNRVSRLHFLSVRAFLLAIHEKTGRLSRESVLLGVREYRPSDDMRLAK